jgi:uncharacterized protein (DUF885 family)
MAVMDSSVSVRTPRQVADAFVDRLVALDPVLGTSLGYAEGRDRLPDLSPAGTAALAAQQRETLAELDAAEQAAGGRSALSPQERRCAVLLRERLNAELALSDHDEQYRRVGTLFSPVQDVRHAFLLMPHAEAADWDAVAARLDAVPAALAGYRQTLAEGLSRGLTSGPTSIRAVVAQLDEWIGAGPGQDWFSGFAATAPSGAPAGTSAAALAAGTALVRLRDWLDTEYRPVAERTGVDAFGPERYARFSRYWNGADLDLVEAYDWAWAEFGRIDAELRTQAALVRPGASVAEAMAYLRDEGPAVEGVDAVRDWLQALMDEAVRELDGTHFDLAEPVRRVEAMIAPAGTAAAPYYTIPALDFSRPGRTWLPTLGATRFAEWDLVTTWYHEGVPGHHLQLGQWVYLAPQLSRYQTAVGTVSANMEGWALYAERLMDELGFLRDPGRRIGYLDAQRARTVRVIVDLGLHLELEVPADQGGAEPFAAGQRWTPALAREFFGRNSGRSAAFLDSEIVRYLEMPGQAISYKLGERAWLAGRDAARQAHASRGEPFDLKAWHMAALSTGSLGLDDLVAELSRL